MSADRARIRRGTKPRQTAPRRTAKAKKPSLFARALELVPVRAETVQRVATWGALGLLGAVGVTALWLMGVPAMAGTAMAEVAGKAGFEVKRVELRGIKNMDRLTVYAIAFDQHSRAMPLVDISKVREDLLRYGWIADARVSRRLPDTLVVDIVERRPSAIWQHRGRLALVDAEGVVLDDVSSDAMPDLPILIGPDANLHSRELAALLDKAPALKPVLAGAAWVGGRRWDLRFQSGEVLALPEGEREALVALTKFAKIDSAQRLLGRGFARFDMRDPTRLVARIDRDLPTIDDEPAADKPAVEEAGAPVPATGLAVVSDNI